MALDFSKFKIDFSFFSRLDARARVAVLLAGVFGALLLVYLGTLWLSGNGSTVGPSRVATAPQNLQSVPGGQLTPEYYRALSQANVQAAEQAKITGGSAVPTLINVGEQQAGGASPCIICADKSANVKSLMNDWVKQGKMTPELADQLDKFAKTNPTPDAYADYLDQLVKENKLTPEQARALLEEYKKQHKQALLSDSEKQMDELIKSGQLPLSAANELLTAQKEGESVSAYASRLQRMVKEGKISPQLAQQLLAQYSQQRAQQIILKSIAILQEWQQQGLIIPEVTNQLIELEKQMVPLKSFQATVNQFVSQNKLTPAVAQKIIDEYKEQKAEIGSSSMLNDIVAAAEAPAYQEIEDLLAQKKISQQVAQQLREMIGADVTREQFTSAVNKMVSDRQMTPDIAKLKIADYMAVKAARETVAMLSSMQENNATEGQYAEALKRAVAAGVITPEQAAELMRQYQAARSKSIAAAPVGTTSEFAELQKRMQQGASGQVATTDQFQSTQQQSTQVSDQERAARIQAMAAAMSGQAQQLVAAWQAPVMEHKAGVEAKSKTTADGAESATGVAGSSATGSTSTKAMGGTPSLIKAGTVIFAVLDTAVNSDYPDSPVMATIVQGPYKGGKLLGRLTTTKGVSGQLDRVTLNFTLMNMDDWAQSKAVTAYAVDPDTARTVLASQVNYHYMMRFGAIMATSFMQGYATAVSTSGATTGIGLNGTQTTSNPQFSPANKMAIAIGQIGQTLGNVTQNYVNIPPTVKVDSGVSLGILFMADVT